VPLLLTLILFEHGMSRNWFVITLAAALPGLAAFRDTFRDDEQSTLTDAAHSLGRKSFAVWWHHLLPDALPGLMGWALRNTGTVMLTLAVLDFFWAAGQAEVPAGWGTLMRIHADNVLDDPLPAIMPAIILALWCVSFRLLSRGFRTESPPAATTAFPT
ncbi:MAG: hypothetical protein WCN98_01020, partial [Verrucomicrobiaceae bacterium]